MREVSKRNVVIRVTHYLIALIVLSGTVYQNCQAGLYNGNERFLIRVLPNGTADELTYFPDGSGAFPFEYAKLGNIGDARRTTRERTEVLDRLGKRIPTDDAVAVANRGADLIRVRKYDDALNALAPLATGRRPDFRVLANFAHLHAQRGEWGEALRRHESALLDVDFPTELAGATPEQRAWLHRVEKDYYKRWLRLHYEEARDKVPPKDEKIFDLFEGKPPADAIAIVQQLLLWCPEDNRLYWLLAELYWKAGKLAQAERLFDSLASEGRMQSNRTLLMAHRAEVKRQLAAAPKPQSVPDTPLSTDGLADTRPWYEKLGLSLTSLIAGVGSFLLVAGLLMTLQLRKMMRG